MAANAALAFAGQHRADAHAFDARRVNRLRLDLINLLVGVNQKFLRVGGIHDVVAGEPAHETIRNLHHLVLTLEHGGNPDAVRGAAILFLDDHVLRNVHELARHVAGIRRLERGVGQTFAGTVGGNEIFQHRQTFAEVGQNGLLDDFAARLGHEAAQTGQLAHLLLVAARAGIHHQKDGVVFLLAMVLFQRLEHHAGNQIRAVRPDVHDLVVTLAGGDDTLAVLLLDFADLLLRVLDLLIALLGHDHVVNADGHAGLRRLAETNFLELVQHDHGFFLAGKFVAFADQVADVGFLHRLVGEPHLNGPDFAEHHAAQGGHDDFLVRVAQHGFPAEIRIRQADAVVRFQRAVKISKDRLFLRAEQRQRVRVRRHRGTRFRRDVITAERNVLGRRDDRLAG